jgi:hypothetical protein
MAIAFDTGSPYRHGWLADVSPEGRTRCRRIDHAFTPAGNGVG